MNINFSELTKQFSNLELENIAHWPKAVKFVLFISLVLIILASSYTLIINHSIAKLNTVKLEELALKQTYKNKYHILTNLIMLEQQIAKAEILFKSQLKSLPKNYEIPSLLDDITLIGTTSGLNVVKLKWQAEIEQEIYVELPIDIEVLGSYHEFGHFVSLIADLPRMITLHNFIITQQASPLQTLKFTLQAKTYRYKKVEKQ